MVNSSPFDETQSVKNGVGFTVYNALGQLSSVHWTMWCVCTE